jgi:hypothetical protein
MNDMFVELLTDLHQSIDLLAQDLARDRPALAAALRRRSAWIPRPEDVSPTARAPTTSGGNSAPSAHSRARAPSSGAVCRQLPPLLYRALDEGVLNAKQFDSLMVGQSRAARALRERKS